MSNQYVGNIGVIDNDILFKGNTRPGKHYAIVTGYNSRTKRVKVNPITSLERDGKIRENKIELMKKGLLFPIPTSASNLGKWSAIELLQVKKNHQENRPLFIRDIDFHSRGKPREIKRKYRKAAKHLYK